MLVELLSLFLLWEMYKFARASSLPSMATTQDDGGFVRAARVPYRVLYALLFTLIIVLIALLLPSSVRRSSHPVFGQINFLVHEDSQVFTYNTTYPLTNPRCEQLVFTVCMLQLLRSGIPWSVC